MFFLKKDEKRVVNNKNKSSPIFSFKELISCLIIKVSSWISTGRSSKIDFFFTTNLVNYYSFSMKEKKENKRERYTFCKFL